MSSLIDTCRRRCGRRPDRRCVGVAERDVDADDQLVHRHRAVAVAVAGAGRGRVVSVGLASRSRCSAGGGGGGGRGRRGAGARRRARRRGRRWRGGGCRAASRCGGGVAVGWRCRRRRGRRVAVGVGVGDAVAVGSRDGLRHARRRCLGGVPVTVGVAVGGSVQPAGRVAGQPKSGCRSRSCRSARRCSSPAGTEGEQPLQLRGGMAPGSQVSGNSITPLPQAGTAPGRSDRSALPSGRCGR